MHLSNSDERERGKEIERERGKEIEREREKEDPVAELTNKTLYVAPR